MIPTNVTVRGAPNPRWWEFEKGSDVLVSKVDPEPNALSILLPEFFLLDVNNWFMVPLPQRAGSVRKLTDVMLTDTFGHETGLGPAFTSWRRGDWGTFALDGDETATSAVDGRFHFVPNVAVEILHNDVLEEVRFLRDEDANLVWAFQCIYTDEDGNQVINGGLMPSDDDGADDGGPRRFVLADAVPPAWVPYVPRQLELAADNGEIYLRGRRPRNLWTMSSITPGWLKSHGASTSTRFLARVCAYVGCDGTQGGAMAGPITGSGALRSRASG